ncbi:MAG: T9SS type A sorting domain-containing protein [Flavobacteriales bacterium]|nr:T9SS type A sorting domain-containing protein [Flavobacteriales bacterium]MBP6696833.1 T9SS type A sorting domain-containing protein [Flavobacteriales bacterium]
MGSLLRYFAAAALIGSAALGHGQGTLTTYYTIPPTNGCDGLWAFGPASAMYDTCPAPYMYALDPSGCAESPWGWPPFWVSGDTAYSNLCSTPCDFQVWSGNGLCQQLICGLGPTALPSAGRPAGSIVSWPNPLRNEDGVLNLDLHGTQVNSVQILDLSGRTLRTARVKPTLMQLDLHGLPAGTYLLKHLVANTCLRTERIVIQ